MLFFVAYRKIELYFRRCSSCGVYVNWTCEFQIEARAKKWIELDDAVAFREERIGYFGYSYRNENIIYSAWKSLYSGENSRKTVE